MKRTPYVFDEFFSSGREEAISPFLTRTSRRWGRDLSLKSAFLAAGLLALAFGFSFVHQDVSVVCLAFVYFLTGSPALIAAIDDLKNLEINIDVLMTVAAFAAVWIGSSLEGALLLVLFEISGALEESVARKAKSAIHHLNDLAPKFAHVVDANGASFEKAVREIAPGALLLVKNGEIVPLDGKVRQGLSLVQLSHLTGESFPVPKAPGDEIPAGARNLEAALVIEVTHTSADSTLSRIIQLITQAAEAKPKLQRWLDRFGKRYATSIISLTFLFALGLPLLFSLPYLGIEGSVYRALAFLIAASPCALIIATPTAYLAAISACAKQGILLKGGVTLDALADCKTIAFDKTGTLTSGKLQCTAIEPPDDKALALAASLERHVVHPIAHAICALAQEKQLPLIPLFEVKTIPGFGITAKLSDGTFVSIGRSEKAKAELICGDIKTHFSFSDPLRENIPSLLHTLKKTFSLRTTMLTGDTQENALSLNLDLDEIHAHLTPEEKLSRVDALANIAPLAMVGDGINDAPALTRATVGISMGRIGSATAVDASDVVLLNDDLSLLPWLFAKAKKTRSIVRQNLTLALSVICLATTPALLGLIPLWLAVLLHEGGTILVGFNSLRLLKSR